MFDAMNVDELFCIVMRTFNVGVLSNVPLSIRGRIILRLSHAFTFNVYTLTMVNISLYLYSQFIYRYTCLFSSYVVIAFGTKLF